MSTAQEIIQSAYNKIGRGSEILSTDQSLLDEALFELIAVMEGLRKNEVILEETVSGVTTTIAVPTLLSTELNEPQAARSHLVNILAVNLMALSRVNPEDVQFVPPISYSEGKLITLYGVPTVPNIVPSTLLPRGQGGSRGGYSTFFNGEALDDDSTAT